MEEKFRNSAISKLRGLLPAAGLVLILAACLVACGREAQSPAPMGDNVTAVSQGDVGWREDRLELGRQTYEQACSSCHDDGEQGAPRIGVRQDWENRSQMWQAVLFNHAKSGYLEMPGKGGQPELSDEAVEAAAEYMLGETFPELPRD